MAVRNAEGELIANLSQASRKDFREAVVVARKALAGWAASTAYLKGQILYRMAEVLEGRREQFVAELSEQGIAQPEEDVQQAIDLLVHYAGWSDKFQSLFSSVNPVASSYFNFSVPEPTGVVAVAGSSHPGLAALVSVLAPVIVGGNTVIVLSHLSAISFAEVLATSDVPAGVANLLTGEQSELLPEFAKHMDVDALVLCSDNPEARRIAELEAAENLKRVSCHPDQVLEASPYHIMACQEVKTTWHPIGV